MGRTREPAVAGMFYPAFAGTLKATVERFLDTAAPAGPTPRALIVPHAGYVYSGPIAGKGYSLLTPCYAFIRRVLLIGPAHRVPVRGVAVPSVTSFRTPLGDVPVDEPGLTLVRALPFVVVSDAAHAEEHSLEVQLPFLQTILEKFTIVPALTGLTTPDEVAQLIETLWNGPQHLTVISTDLSHYLTYGEAKEVDEATARAIERAEPESIDDHDACGAAAIRGLLTFVRRRGLKVERIDLRNSGDTAGPRDRVVGYGAFAVYEPK